MIDRINPLYRRIGTLGCLGIALLVLLGGCRRAKAPVVAAAPPPPAITGPVSEPQVTAQLPPSQPIPPEAIPREREAPVPAESVPAQAPRTTQRPRQTATAPLVTAAPPPATQPPAAAPQPPQTGAPAPQLRPMFTEQEERDLRDRIERSLTSAEQLLSRVASDTSKRSAAARVQGFIRQAKLARNQGDLNRARSLADRAEVLASDLARTSK